MLTASQSHDAGHCLPAAPAAASSVSSSRSSINSNEPHSPLRNTVLKTLFRVRAYPRRGWSGRLLHRVVCQTGISDDCKRLQYSATLQAEVVYKALSRMVTGAQLQMPAAAVLNCCMPHTACHTTADYEVATRHVQQAVCVSLASFSSAACCSRLI